MPLAIIKTPKWTQTANSVIAVNLLLAVAKKENLPVEITYSDN